MTAQHLLIGFGLTVAAFAFVAGLFWNVAGAATRGQHRAARGDRDYGPGVTPVDVAGQTLYLGQDHTAPGVRLPFTPPPPGRFVPQQLPPLPPPPEVANPVTSEVASGNGHLAALVERYERLFPDTRPDWVKEISPYPDNAMAVESMFTRAQALIVRALDDGEVHGG
jgi:hypothetical protein